MGVLHYSGVESCGENFIRVKVGGVRFARAVELGIQGAADGGVLRRSITFDNRYNSWK